MAHAPHWPPAGHGRPAWQRAQPGRAGPRLTQSQTDSHYILDIDGVEPSTVQVEVVGQGLLVRIAQQASLAREEQRPDGGAVVRSYQWRSASRARRLALPWDALPGDLTQEVLAAAGPDGQQPPRDAGAPLQRVRVLIPRRGSPEQSQAAP